jgi:hypothetical protein
VATIVTRSGKGSSLTNAEIDANFNNLNNDKLETSAYTAADVLAKLVTVDGAGSGLDADLLDGLSSASFATAASLANYLPLAGGTIAGNVTMSSGVLRLPVGSDLSLSSTLHTFQIGASNSTNLSLDDNEIMARSNGVAAPLYLNAEGGAVYIGGATSSFVAVVSSRSISPGTGLTGGGDLSANRTLTFDTTWGDARYLTIASYTAGDILTKLLTVDGAGSGLDADFLDGQSSAYFTDIVARLGYTPVTNARTVTAGTGITGGGDLTANRSFAFDQTYGDGRYALSGHTHNYLPLAGGTLAGATTFNALATFNNGVYVDTASSFLQVAGQVPLIVGNNNSDAIYLRNDGSGNGLGIYGGAWNTGSMRMRISVAGNVTINAPSSGHTLDLAGTSSINLPAGGRVGYWLPDSATIDGALVAHYGMSCGVVHTGYANGGTTFSGYGGLKFITLGESRLNIAQAGNVTINAPSSGAALEVNTAAHALRLKTSVARGGGSNYLNFADPSGESGYFGFGGANSDFHVWNSLNSPMYFGTNGATRLTIAADGAATFAQSLGANRVWTGYDSGQGSSVSCSNWFRSNGDTGWFNASYSGGIYMTEANYVRTYNGKALRADVGGNGFPALYLSRDSASYFGKVLQLDTTGATGDGPQIWFRRQGSYEWGVGICAASSTSFGIYNGGSGGTFGTLAWELAANGYMYLKSWTHLNGHYGLYAPSHNNAYFYPNDASYGSWRISGTRNGWAGLSFNTSNHQMSLMMAHDFHGVHNDSVGWRYYNESGNAYFPGNVVAYWSDRRLKENFRDLSDAELWETLAGMKAQRFNWNSKVTEMGLPIAAGKEEVSLIAQDVQEVLADAVRVNMTQADPMESSPDFVGPKKQREYLSINYDKITPFLVEAVNRLQARVLELEARL